MECRMRKKPASIAISRGRPVGVGECGELQVQGEEGMNIKGWMDKVGTSREGSM
jgi:hypothetical protein